MAHIFISYSHNDFEFAENLELRLQKEGFETWMDEERLTAGEDWREEIDIAIKDSFALLLVLTPKALESRYVTYEWSFAWGNGKKVIPLLLNQVDDDKLHPRLDRRQHLDFTTRKGRPWSKLFQRLKELEKAFQEASNIKLVQEQKVVESGKLSNSIVVKLLNDLNEGNASTRLGVIKTLRQFDDDDAIDGLIKALLDGDRGVRKEAAIALGEKSRDDIPYALLVRLYGDQVVEVRIAAANSLADLGTTEAIDGLIDVATTVNDYDLREACIYRLADFVWSSEDQKYVPVLRKYLVDHQDNIDQRNKLELTQSDTAKGGLQVVAESLMNVDRLLQLRIVTAEIDLCDAVASILEQIGTPEALAADEVWQRKRKNQQ